MWFCLYNFDDFVPIINSLMVCYNSIQLIDFLIYFVGSVRILRPISQIAELHSWPSTFINPSIKSVCLKELMNSYAYISISFFCRVRNLGITMAWVGEEFDSVKHADEARRGAPKAPLRLKVRHLQWDTPGEYSCKKNWKKLAGAWQCSGLWLTQVGKVHMLNKRHLNRHSPLTSRKS